MHPESNEPAALAIETRSVPVLARRVGAASSAFVRDEEGLSTVDFAMVGYLVCLVGLFGTEILAWAVLAYRRWAIYGWSP